MSSRMKTLVLVKVALVFLLTTRAVRLTALVCTGITVSQYQVELAQLALPSRREEERGSFLMVDALVDLIS